MKNLKNESKVLADMIYELCRNNDTHANIPDPMVIANAINKRLKKDGIAFVDVTYQPPFADGHRY